MSGPGIGVGAPFDPLDPLPYTSYTGPESTDPNTFVALAATLNSFNTAPQEFDGANFLDPNDVAAAAFLPANEGQTFTELYLEALSKDPVQARAAIATLQHRAHNGDPDAAAALVSLVPVLQERAEMGFPHAENHLKQIANVAELSPPVSSVSLLNQGVLVAEQALIVISENRIAGNP